MNDIFITLVKDLNTILKFAKDKDGYLNRVSNEGERY
jgi:hypothetical protein